MPAAAAGPGGGRGRGLRWRQTAAVLALATAGLRLAAAGVADAIHLRANVTQLERAAEWIEVRPSRRQLVDATLLVCKPSWPV